MDVNTFAKIKMCSDDQKQSFQWNGSMAVSYEETEALREINGNKSGIVRAMISIDVQNDPQQILKLDQKMTSSLDTCYLFNPSLTITKCSFDVKH